MGLGELDSQAFEEDRLMPWRERHPYLYYPSWVFIWLVRVFRQTLTVIFATWPSMHDPVSQLLNAANEAEADKLTEKWTQGKLQELNYVGLSVRSISL